MARQVVLYGLVGGVLIALLKFIEYKHFVKKMVAMKAIYDNPVMNAAMTFLEPFPVGLIVTLVSAAILRKRPAAPSITAAALA